MTHAHELKRPDRKPVPGRKAAAPSKARLRAVAPAPQEPAKPVAPASFEMPKSRIKKVNLPDKGLVGWVVLFSTNGQRVSKFFSDAKYGSSAAAERAATAYAEENSWCVAEFLSLRRRLLPRKNTRYGKPGITRYEGGKERGPYWVAYWNDPKGKKIQKRFAVSLYGERGARQMATKTRQNAIDDYLKLYEELLAFTTRVVPNRSKA